MKTLATLLVATVGLTGARFAREAAGPGDLEVEEPYAPSPAAAPIVVLGYREVAADLLFIRLTGYFGSLKSTANGVASLVEAIITLDPKDHRIYEYGARVMTIASEGVTQSTYLRALAVLERGGLEFPDDWKLPSLAGEIYTQDLATKDPAQRRAWDEKGTLLVESAIRKPNAPTYAATWAATMRSRLGQHDRAVAGLREMILLTPDVDARQRMLDKLTKLEDSDQQEVAAELYESQRRFTERWERERPMLPPTLYVLLGAHLTPGFDLTDLATGGADLVGSEPVEQLEPLE